MADKKPPRSAYELLKRYKEGERDFEGAYLVGAIFSGGVYFNREDSFVLKIRTNNEIDLEKANLRRAQLGGARLFGANLSGADLSEAYLNKADLELVDLSGANLSEAYLNKADLELVDLSGANLSGANLSGANLVGSNLKEAHLENALLQNTLLYVDLTDAILDNARLDYSCLRWDPIMFSSLSLNVRSVGLFGSVQDVRDVVLHADDGTPVYLTDVAEVTDGAMTRMGAVSRDGEGEVVAGMVIMLKGENSKEVV